MNMYNIILDVSKIDLPMINELLSFIPLENINIDKDIIGSNMLYLLNQQDEKVNKEYVIKDQENVRKQIKQIEYEQLKEIYNKIINLLPFRHISWKNIFCEDIVTKFLYDFIQNDFKNDIETFTVLMSNVMMNAMAKSKQLAQDLDKILQE